MGTADQRKRLEEVLKRNEKSFEPTTFDEKTAHTRIKHIIELLPGVKAFHSPPHRFSPLQADALKKIIQKYTERGWIQSTHSDWAAPAFMVPKKTFTNGVQEYRMVVDYRRLNLASKPSQYPLPRIDEIFNNKKVFSWFSPDRFGRTQQKTECIYHPMGVIPIQRAALRAAQCTSKLSGNSQ